MPTAGHAAEPSPVSLWIAIDSSTGKPEALVRIVEKNGGYSGTSYGSRSNG
jgi:hypothetical protein